MAAEFVASIIGVHKRNTASHAGVHFRAQGRQMGIYVYMLRCADNSYYIGSATGDDLQPRIDQHNAGAFPGYTFHRRPVVLVRSEHFDRITDGIAAERQIKGWSRAKKEALIRNDWRTISHLSRRVGKSRRR
jgi:putative endonuclease